MRLECDLAVQRGGGQLPRTCKGFVSIGKSKLKSANGTNYELQLSTVKDRNQPPFELSAASVNRVMTTFVSAGKLTIMMKQPSVSVFVSKANPERLGRFVTKVRAILNGQEVEMDKIEQVRPTDFRTTVRTISVTNRKDYPNDGFPAQLEKLQMTGIGLQRIDGRWFSLKLLSTLDLSNNLLAKAPNIVQMANISRLQNLQALNLANNQIVELPANIWKQLPLSLISLDMSANLLSHLPRDLFRLKNLKRLNLSGNRLHEIPDEIISLTSLNNLDLSSNLIQIVPFLIRRLRFDQLSLSNNPFLPHLPTHQSTPHSVTTLEQIAAAQVAKHGLSESILPRHLQSQLPSMRALCAQCVQWSPRDGMRVLYRSIRPSQTAILVDVQTVPARVSLCYNCKSLYSL